MVNRDRSRRVVRLGVVGLGPRGLSVLERLCANATQLISAQEVLHVEVIDPYATSGGRVWWHRQHPELLMNTVASQVTMFVDGTVECAGPVLPGPNLYEWARSIVAGKISGVPAAVRAEAGRLGPDSYPSRAFYGHYLTWTLHRLIRTMPRNVRIHLHRTSAVDLRDGDDGSQTVVLASGRELRGLRAVVLAQGHLPAAVNHKQAALAGFAAEHGLCYVPPSNPADVPLDRIAPGQPTVLSGLGLNFFDYMALLTIGRGGSFRRGPDGRLRYRPSGGEPRLIAGSRRGIPFHARGENQKGVSGRHDPLFLTPSVIAELRARARQGMPVDFRTDVWPLIDREVRTVYYTTLVATRRGTADAAVFLRHYVDIARAQLAATTASSAAEPALLAGFGISGPDLWDWRLIERPYAGGKFAGTAEFQAWLLDYLRTDVREALRGNVGSPLKAALDVLRDMRNEIRLVVDHGGVGGNSYRNHLQSWYMPLNAYLSIGPPVQRIEQLIALIEAGVLELLGPELVVEPCAGERAFVASSAMLPDRRVRATALIEARLPDSDLPSTTDPLLRNLLARGEVRTHRIPNGDGSHYATGGLAVTERPYHLIDVENRPHPRRFAFGVPTETVHWITAAGIRPGVNSVILGDADALARACLLAGDETTRTALSALSA